MSRRILVHPLFGAAGLFCLLAGASLLFFRGSLLTSDELTMAMTTGSLAERGSLFFAEEVYGKLYTNYGVGTPVAGLPIYFLEKSARGIGLLTTEHVTLMPLLNTLLFALTGILLGGMMEGQQRWAALGLVFLAGPFLPASLTFYSEMLTAAGFAGLAMATYRSAPISEKPTGQLRLLCIAAFLAALAAMSARVAAAPMLLLILAWGWWLGGRREVLLAGAFGLVTGVLVFFLQNQILRGGPFQAPYAGQEFTTPLLTGLYGLLFSPERGIFIFYPAVAVVLAGWLFIPERSRPVAALAVALTLFSIVFHGQFWTWHGGWTTGPRFLLPCLVLFAVPAAELWRARQVIPPGIRVALYLALIWSGILAYIYSRYAAFHWWNQLWGFHQIENQWLFFPQMSLWQAWFDGVRLPGGAAEMSRAFWTAVFGFALSLIVISLYPLLLPYRGRLGTDPPEAARLLPLRFERLDIAFLVLLVVLGGLYGTKLLSGPRGWRVLDATGVGDARMPHLLANGQAGMFEGWLDNPLASRLKLHVKANALYWIYVDEELLLEQREPVPHQHLNSVEFPVEPGRYYHLRVRVLPKDAATPPLFHLYWTWGGEGVYLAPAGGEYLHPRPLEPHERFFTRLWRRKFHAAAFMLALVLLYGLLPAAGGRKALI